MKVNSNLEKYLSYYGNISLNEYSLNEVDYMYFSLLSYMHIENVPNKTSYSDFCDLAIKNAPSKRYGRLIPKVIEIIKKSKDCSRYKDFKVNNYQYIVDEKTQFGALVFYLDKLALVSFTGSDGTVIGWYENIRGGYMYPTYSQNKAQEYLKSIIKDYDSFILLGHSKGGNLAMASAFNLSPKEKKKIISIYNFDGPGFPKEITNGEEYQSIEDKITNYIPELSYVGSMLYHGGTTRIIKTLTKGIDVHFQFNWELFGGFIVNGTELSERSKYIHSMTTDRFDKLNREEIKNMMENAFSVFTLDRKGKLKITFKDLVKGIELNQKYDLVTRKEVREILNTLVFNKAK